MSKTLITVIIPVYNTEPYLQKCLDSVVNQTYNNSEILLIDDGSTDNSSKICDLYSQNNENIRVIHQNNKGLTAARSVGIENATGKYVLFVDSDDYILQNHIANIVKIIEEYKCDVINVSYKSFTNEIVGKSILCNIPEGYYNKKKLNEEVYPNMLFMPPYYSFGIYPTIWSKCIKKEILKKNNIVPYEIVMGEDAALSYPCLLDADSLYIYNKATYMYRQNEDSIMHKYDEKMIDKIIFIINYINRIKQIKNWNDHEQVDYYVLMLCEIAIHNEFKRSSKKNFKRLLNNQYVKKALNNKKVKIESFGTKLKMFAFKHNLPSLIYLLNTMSSLL